MKLLFVHGWGFDRHFWEPVCALLPNHEHLFEDRGYFGNPLQPHIDGPFLAVTHSLGAMRVLSEGRPGLTGIMAINGFDRFSARSGREGIALRVIDRMLRRFNQDPAAVLSEFRTRCGCEAEFGPLDLAPLHEDLLRLRDGEAPTPHVPVTVLQGSQDPLMPHGMRESVFPHGPVRRIGHGGGHLLPLQDPAFCADAIRHMAESLPA